MGNPFILFPLANFEWYKDNSRRISENGIAASCDYLENVKGIGIHKAYALIRGNHMFENLAKKGAPKDYEEHFGKALAVFNHQTVFSIDKVT